MPVPLLLRHHHRRQLLLVLVVLVACFHGGSSDDTYDTSICLQEPKPCVNVSIKYPFYLSDQETGVVKGNNNSYCGYPGLAIRCDDDDWPIIQLNGENYNVTGINYENFTVSLADPDVFKNEKCPRAEHNTTVPPTTWLSLPPDNIDSLFFLINCSVAQPYLTLPPAGDRINCQGFGDVPGPSFVFPKDQVPPGNWSQACNEVLQVPVVKSDPIDPTPGWRSGGYGSDLRRGFQLLVWDERRRSPSCNQCERSRGRCGYNETGGFIGCLCQGGRLNYATCPRTGTLFEPETFSSLQKLHVPVDA